MASNIFMGLAFFLILYDGTNLERILLRDTCEPPPPSQRDTVSHRGFLCGYTIHARRKEVMTVTVIPVRPVNGSQLPLCRIKESNLQTTCSKKLQKLNNFYSIVGVRSTSMVMTFVKYICVCVCVSCHSSYISGIVI